MGLRTTSFDRLIESAPVDSAAARVTCLKRPEYEYEAQIRHWKSPPPETCAIVDVRGNKPKFGEVFGRFTVIGAFGSKVPKRANGFPCRAQYVVRCTCGDYEVRTAQDLRSNKSRAHHLNACFNCMRLDNLRSNKT